MGWERALALPVGRGRVRVGFDPAEPMLIPHRITTKMPPPNGADITFCSLSEGRVLYCKDDNGPRRIRAAELLSTRLAGEVGILTPDCAVVEDREGRTFFGSVGIGSMAGAVAVQAYLTTIAVDETARPDAWLGRYLSALYAFDAFIGNVDRNLTNFAMDLSDRQLRAYDFASVNLRVWSDDRISIEQTNTHSLGRDLREIHSLI